MYWEGEMKVDSYSFRAFYSGHYDSKLDSKPGEYLVMNYQKATKLLDDSLVDLSQKFKTQEKYLAFKEKLENLKSQYFSALCNRYMGVVFNSGRRIISNSISDSDMVSYGEEVLLQCALKYKFDKNISFITYFTNAVFNMSYTLVRKKHFRDWNINMASLNTLMEIDDRISELSEDKKFIPAKKKKPLVIKPSKINEELDKILFNPELAESIKVKLGIKDDLFLHYLILKTKHKKSTINSDETEKLSYLEPIYENDYNNFSKIYMYESDIDDYREKIQKNRIKEEILCQE